MTQSKTMAEENLLLSVTSGLTDSSHEGESKAGVLKRRLSRLGPPWGSLSSQLVSTETPGHTDLTQ